MTDRVTADDLPLLERRRVEARVLVPLIRALQERFGSEAVNGVVAGVISELARSQGADQRGDHEVRVPDIRRLVRLTGPVAEGSLTATMHDGDDQNFGFDVTHCQFVEMYRELDASDLGFLLSCSRDFTYSEGLAPELSFSRSQTLMQGASFCDFRYSDPEALTPGPASPAPVVT